jgi:NADH:ubiquinone oxidoreductase subunit F (NADH-binding)/(2Fe-2S) ferredoxin/Pyruvate/2-oxoacid:ferredoxin oxidoreductase delta subunit
MAEQRSIAELELEKRRKKISARRDKILAEREPSSPAIMVCGGTGCLALASDEVAAAFEKSLSEQGIAARVELKTTGCPGFCEQGPLVTIHPERIFYTKVKPKDVEEIISRTILKGEIIDHLLYEDPLSGEKIVYETEVPCYKEQTRILLKESGLIDPRKIEDYLAAGGYKAVEKALLEMTPEQVIAEIKESGLRGRGGAGFPTGVKWELCRKAAGETKYIICNADEGDPGAFQDRGIIEGNPHSILEGMIIGAYAMGASQGFVYIRNEYPLAVELISLAAEQAREAGLLGEDILGTGFNFDLIIQLGAGAFVCGEETALMASIEGYSGEPRPRPPYPAESGLWGMPTNINNTKTWAWVRHIINNGADWFAQMGTEKSKGTTIFSVVGKIKNTGLVEVPMGISLRHLIEHIGGGVSNGSKLKAVQTGGPSGGCIPESLWHLPVDYDSLREAGSMMGSGGMIVMDENTCMVDMARYFLNFSRFESCGKCTACREGVRRMHEILDYITRGYGEEGDIEHLENLGQAVKTGALCGLGQTAPNPVLTTIRYFREEYEAHIRDKNCPAGVCKELITFYVIPEQCPGCGLCARYCAEDAITGEKGKPYVIDEEKCVRCGVCREVCNFDAVKVR